MVDAAKDWIAPYWMSAQSVNGIGYQPAQVWIWNPGLIPTAVTVRFCNSDGGIVTGNERDVPSFARRLFEASQPHRFLDWSGWCHITSEHPVVPWGFTGYDANARRWFANMTFYRSDAEVLKLHVPTTAPRK